MLVVDTVEDGHAAVDDLARQDKGKATFICLQWVPRLVRSSQKRLPESMVWASDVVRCDTRFQSLVNFLLDDVVIVESLQAARHVFARHTGLRCISLDGQVATSGGIVRGGSRGWGLR